VSNSIILRDFLVERGIIGIVSNFRRSSRIPAFLAALITTQPVPPDEVMIQLHRIFVVMIESASDSYIPNVLASLSLISESGIPFDMNFVLVNLEKLLSSDNDDVLVNLLNLLAELPDVSVGYSRRLFDRVICSENRRLFRPLCALFVKKYDQWNGPMNDELIELVLHMRGILEFRSERQIVSVLILYFDFDKVCDIRVIEAISKFVGDPELGGMCIEAIWRNLRTEMTVEDRMRFIGIMDEVLADLENVSDADAEAAPAASKLLRDYEEWKGIV
jgi:hypothetical protein